MDASRIADTLDGDRAQALHLRADGIAATPMVRAAIETDAATMHDLATNEMVFTPQRGEVLEVFQVRDGTPTSLLRVPTGWPALDPLKGRETRVRTDGKDVVVIASAPVGGYQSKITGMVVVAMPAELAGVRRLRSASTRRVRRSSASTSRWCSSIVPRRVRPRRSLSRAPSGRRSRCRPPPSRPRRASPGSPARWGSVGLAGLGVLVYVIGFVRSRRREETL